MNNRISDLFRERGIKVSPFARENGINQNTLYTILKLDEIDNVSISVFLKIARGLGMTAEELYYGTPPPAPSYSDARQVALNGYYESMNEKGKDTLVESAHLMAGSPDVRLEKNNGEDVPFQAAMGA